MSIESNILSYVSRETYEKFKVYQKLIAQWNRQTCLVQIDTMDDFMNRHVLDSLQLLPLIHTSAQTIDIGTGAGFPGMVLALAGVKNITLCDSNVRKTIFLEEVKRLLSVDVIITCSRVENFQNNQYSQIITRACANLSTLLEQSLLVSRETNEPLVLFALKGKNSDAEIQEAEKLFSFNYKKINSVTKSDGAILKITNIMRV